MKSIGNKRFAFYVLHFAFAAATGVVYGNALASAPELSFDGDTITITVPEGTVSTNAALHLCWGAVDAGTVVTNWAHYTCITADGVMPTGGVWTASAATLGISEDDAMRAIVVGPISYREVEYVETPSTVSAGDSYRTLAVRTGVEAKSGLHVKTKVMWLANGDTALCGGRYNSGDADPTRMFAVSCRNSKWNLGYGTFVTNTVPCSLNTAYEVESKLYRGLQTLVVDNIPVYEFDNTDDVVTGGDCGVFAYFYKAFSGGPRNPEDNPYRCQSHSRCYYLKMWENGNTTDNPEGDLVRDFVPVKDANGYGALYDKVTRTVFEPISRGTQYPQHLNVGAETGATYYSVPQVAGYSRLRHYLRDSITATVRRGRVTVAVQTYVAIGQTNELVVCWGNRDYGERAADWPHVLPEHYPVGEAGGTFVFNMEEISSNPTIRAFLVESMGLADYISSAANASQDSISAYFDTGVKMKDYGLRVETRIEWLAKWDDFGFMGARNGSDKNTRFFPIYGYQYGQWGYGYGSNGNWNKGEFAINTPYEVESKLYVGEQWLKVDGETKFSSASTWVPDYNANIYVFAMNFDSPKQGCRAKCYYLKMYTGGAKNTNPDGDLARDYIPAVRDGIAGMYDRLNNTFTASAGLNAFRYGSVTNTVGWTATTYCTSAPKQTAGGFMLIVR